MHLDWKLHKRVFKTAIQCMIQGDPRALQTTKVDNM